MASSSPTWLSNGLATPRIGPFATALLEQQRAKNELLGILASDSAWEMLLFLLIQREDRRTVSIVDLCRSTTMPVEVAMRWILALEDAALIAVRSQADSAGGRVVELTASTAERLRRLLDGWINA